VRQVPRDRGRFLGLSRESGGQTTEMRSDGVPVRDVERAAQDRDTERGAELPRRVFTADATPCLSAGSDATIAVVAGVMASGAPTPSTSDAIRNCR